jgi:aspartate kinase
MRVFKFGGASIADAGRMAALLPIIQEEQQPVLLVLSALGKTTNALEVIVNLACKDEKAVALDAVLKLRKQHLDIAAELLNKDYYQLAEGLLHHHFAELEQAVRDVSNAHYDRSYDQVV